MTLSPPNHLPYHDALACLRLELQDVYREDGRPPPATLAHARQWAVELGCDHPVFDIVRNCATVLRYACHVHEFTMQG